LLIYKYYSCVADRHSAFSVTVQRTCPVTSEHKIINGYILYIITYALILDTAFVPQGKENEQQTLYGFMVLNYWL